MTARSAPAARVGRLTVRVTAGDRADADAIARAVRAEVARLSPSDWQSLSRSPVRDASRDGDIAAAVRKALKGAG